ncbi:MAG TPA: glycosyltransferase [Chryseolinea sp.]|nr:glycosyltransferase [Chryseolinea sp.]
MIFVTIGTQGPFDRLIRTVDRAAEYFDDPIVAQIATDGKYAPVNMKTSAFMPYSEFHEHFRKSRMIIAHAGMGTIINALVEYKPIIILPRLAKYGEQRNDHQWDTAKALEKLGYVHAAYDEDELFEKLKLFATTGLKPLHSIGEFAAGELITALRKDLNHHTALSDHPSFEMRST